MFSGRLASLCGQYLFFWQRHFHLQTVIQFATKPRFTWLCSHEEKLLFNLNHSFHLAYVVFKSFTKVCKPAGFLHFPFILSKFHFDTFLSNHVSFQHNVESNNSSETNFRMPSPFFCENLIFQPSKVFALNKLVEETFSRRAAKPKNNFPCINTCLHPVPYRPCRMLGCQ